MATVAAEAFFDGLEVAKNCTAPSEEAFASAKAGLVTTVAWTGLAREGARDQLADLSL